MEATKGLCTVVMPETRLREFAFQHAVDLNSDNALLEEQPQLIAAAMETRRRWPVGMTLRVHFLEGERAVQRHVEEIVAEWSQHANVQFVFGAGPEAEIRISFNPNSGSWSYMGTDCSLSQPQNPKTP